MSTFAVCLDPNSPNFSTSTLSSNGFSIYCDVDNFTIPVAQNIPVADLLPPPNGNCPLIINVPLGATQIIVIDQCTGPINTAALFNPVDIAAGVLATDCCYSIIDLPAAPLPWCVECGIEFDTFQTSSIGRLIAGNVISSCGPVTDYVIGWYLNGDYSSPAITTGLNTTANFVFQYPHPLTSNSSVPVLAGSYEGIIHDIIINGITYSSVSGSANGVPLPFESCFDTVVVDPLTCDNGTSPGKYSHQFTFNSQAAGAVSSPVSLTYQLSPTTQYFALAFKAGAIWDEIELKWISGDPSATSNPSLYSQPIYLEKVKIGGDVGTLNDPDSIFTSTFGYNSSLNPTISNINNLWPKTSNSIDWFQKVLTLANLETSSNPSFPDFLEITITPNPTNNNTSWQAAFQCLDTFDCGECAWDDYPNSLPKIWKIELDKLYQCDQQKLFLYHTGCIDYSDWMGEKINDGTPLSNPNINLINSTQENPNQYLKAPLGNGVYISLPNVNNCSQTNPYPQDYQLICSPPSTGTITLNKTPQQIQLTFNSQTDYLHYKDALLYQASGFFGGVILNQSLPIPCNLIQGVNPYYITFRISIPIALGGSSTANCGDNTTPIHYRFNANDYFNINYVENPGSNFWSITIPQTTIVNCSTPLGCDTCPSAINAYIQNYNAEISNINALTYVTTVGSKYSNPFSVKSIYKSTSAGASGSYCYATDTLEFSYNWYSINTVPFISSSTGWVNVPSLGAPLPCDLIPYPEITSDNFGKRYIGYANWYQVRFPNLTSSFNYSLSTNDFEVYARTGYGPTGSIYISQGVYPPPCPDPLGKLIYSYIGGVATMYSSSFFWQGNNPTLIIDP